MKETHSKMTNLVYKELKTQNYLKNQNISVKQAQNLFKFRTRVAKFKENYKNNYEVNTCPLCLVQPDTQAHCVQCPVVKENVNIKGDYQEIFTNKISSEISETLFNITDFREAMAKKLSPAGGPGAPDMVLQTDM